MERDLSRLWGGLNRRATGLSLLVSRHDRALTDWEAIEYRPPEFIGDRRQGALVLHGPLDPEPDSGDAAAVCTES